MGSSNRCALKTVAVFHIAFFLSYLPARSAQGKFAEAARLWAQLAKSRKSEAPETARRIWKWWRAKFYELDCCAKMPQTDKMSVLHTTEVLESSFTDIPPFWAKKLNLLKQKCRYSKKENNS